MTDLEEKIELEFKVDYYERLIDYLDDMVPCLDTLIAQFDEEDENE